MDPMSSLKDLKLTKDEVDRLAEAFKKEEFRKLFAEYTEEISNPENRKLYEEEIARLEQERGMDVTFLHPTPGYVLKTSKDGKKKVFINICKNDNIEKPNFNMVTKDGGKKGMQWSIPHSFSPARPVTDKKKDACDVYDFVVHPDTYRMCETNQRFKKMVEDTALEGIEKSFSVTLDRVNIKRPKAAYKGTPEATVMRKKIPDHKKEETISDVFPDLKYPYDSLSSEEKTKEREKQAAEKKKKNAAAEKKKKEVAEADVQSVAEYETPRYTIKHQNPVDLQDFTAASEVRARPANLVITVFLPLISTSESIDVACQGKKKLIIQTEKPAKYKLTVKLPYRVNEDESSAKFTTDTHELNLVLPVIQKKNVNDDDDDDEDDMEDIRARITRMRQTAEEYNRNKLKEQETRNGDKATNGEEAYTSDGIEDTTSKGDEQYENSRETDFKENGVEHDFTSVQSENPASVIGDKDVVVEAGSDIMLKEECTPVHEEECTPVHEEECTPVHEEECKPVHEVEYTPVHDEECTPVHEQESIPVYVPHEPKIHYILPSYDFHQNDEMVTFIIHAKNVDRESIKQEFTPAELGCSGAEVTMKSVGSGGFPLYYKLRVMCSGAQYFNSNESRIDVGSHNVVINLAKTDASLGLWDSVLVGHNSEDVEAKHFITDKSLIDKLNALDARQEQGKIPEALNSPADDGGSATSRISQSSPQKQVDFSLPQDDDGSIDVTSPRTRSVSEGGNSASHIEVVHKKAPPPIHGILKRSYSRSMSESSEESSRRLNSSGGDLTPSGDAPPDSPDMNGSFEMHHTEPNIKKSVSFNDKVDQATFQAGKCVKTLTATLKNRRRNARRKEDRQTNRRERKNSGGSSEGSITSEHSGDEHGQTEKQQNPSKKANSKKKKKRGGRASLPADGSAVGAGAVADTVNGSVSESETSESESKSDSLNGEDSNHGNSSENAKGATQGNAQEYVREGDAKVETNEEKEAKVKAVSSLADQVGKVNLHDANDGDSDDNDETQNTLDEAKQEDVFKPDTILSWDENSSSLNEHKSVCEVEFTNTSAFELDLD